jgi:quercetin dioxygenase-like cupin family protein
MNMSKQHKNQQTLDSETIATISEALDSPGDSPGNSPELTEDRKFSMKQRIFERIHNQTADGINTIREHEGQWIDVAPKLQMKVLRQDHKLNSQTALWQLEPGAIIPAHKHPVEEECLVIKGEINFGPHVLHEGDFEVVPAGIDHIAMESKTGAIVLLRSDIPEDLSWIS